MHGNLDASQTLSGAKKKYLKVQYVIAAYLEPKTNSKQQIGP